ncbi:MAG: arginine repressor [Clostridia bacterium]|nr:arginine repressor [Clostridia bacterium]
MKKAQRHAAILDLIQRKTIRTQEELLDELKALGFDTTQATVSRDIRDLKIIKTTEGSGGYQYAVAAPSGDGDFASKLKTIFSEAVYRVDCACNIVVLKTYAGMGSAAGVAVDSMHLEGVVGTLSGDDTMFIAARTYEDAANICAVLSGLLK